MENNVKSIEGYDVLMRVTSLDEVTKLVDVIKKTGFSDFSVTPRISYSSSADEYEYKKKRIGRYNNFILASLSYAKAVDEKNALTVEQILEIGLKNLPTFLNITPQNEGIARRTINVLAKVTLADRYNQVRYTKTDPKKFWLTQKGKDVVKKYVVKDES